MTRRLRLLSFALLVVAASACGRYLTTGVAVVNGEMITREALDRQVASVYGNPQFQGAINPDDAEQRLQIERQVIVQLIQDELIRQEGKRLKVNVTSAQVNERFQAIAATQPDEIQREIQARGEAAVRELIRGQIIAEKLAELAGGTAPPTEAEIRVAYGNGQRFEEIHVRHILFLVQAGTDEAAAQKKAQDALKKLQGGSDFATLAKQVSEDPGSKDAGGDLGFITREVNFDETFLNAAFAVKAGKISGLVRTQFGFHIIRVDERRTKTLEQARAELTEEIATAKRSESFQGYIVERLRAADIVVNPRWGDFDPETFEIQNHEFFVPPSPEPETQPIPFQ
jgi:parvulin-like peptidyl-prolyl isomerase